MFTDAKNSIQIATSRGDSTGFTVRGGTNLQTGASSQSTALFRAKATTGSGCGTFDFKGSMQEAFEKLPGLFENLLQAVIHEMPMLALCYLSPTLCDLSKHFQNLLNLAIQHKYAQCQQMQAVAMYGGLRLRGGEIGRCLEEEAENGTPISQAMERCNQNMTSMRSPLGFKAGEVNLLAETLEAAGASAEVRVLAHDLLGEVNMRANGSLLTNAERPSQRAMLARFETHKGAARAAIQAVQAEYQATGTVTAETLRAASSPSQGMPMVAAEALARLGADPVRGPAVVEEVSTAQAIERLTWECQELQATLEAATEDNQHLSAAEKELNRTRYAAIQRELLFVAQKVDVRDKYVTPAFDKLLREYTAVQDQATRAGLQAPLRTTPLMPYRSQQPAGYAR
jgi:hypothetical protein